MGERTAARIASINKDIQRGGKAEILHRDQHAWAHSISMALAFPGLRGLWPMSLVSAGGIAEPIAGNAGQLSYNGNPQYGNDGFAPYIDLDGAGDYLSHIDSVEFDIRANEAYMENPGLTVGCFMYPGDTANFQGIFSKWGGAGGRSYLLYAAGNVAGDPVRFNISDDGTNSDPVSSVSGYSANTWHFVCARFDDSDAGNELAIWLNDEKTTAGTARNSIFNSGSAVSVGSLGAASYFTGRLSLVFLVASAVPDALIGAFYQQARAVYSI